MGSGGRGVRVRKEDLLFLKKKKQKDFYSFGTFAHHHPAKNHG
jgi:hypothetical protein